MCPPDALNPAPTSHTAAPWWERLDRHPHQQRGHKIPLHQKWLKRGSQESVKAKDFLSVNSHPFQNRWFHCRWGVVTHREIDFAKEKRESSRDSWSEEAAQRQALSREKGSKRPEVPLAGSRRRLESPRQQRVCTGSRPRSL